MKRPVYTKSQKTTVTGDERTTTPHKCQSSALLLQGT